jgi:hypothetical protein
MQKILLLLITINCSLFTIKAQNDDKTKNDLAKLNLKGNIKSVSEIKYKATEKDGLIQKGTKETGLTYTYNVKGYCTEFYYDKNKSTYKFDNQDHLIESISYLSDGSMNIKHIYKYDSKWNQVAELQYVATGILLSKDTFFFDDKGMKTAGGGYFNLEDGTKDGTCIYKYDANGNRSELISYRYNGSSLSMEYKTVFENNDQGNQTARIEYNADGSLDTKTIMKYNDKNKVVENTSYDAKDNLLRKTTSIYDDKGNRIEENTYTAETGINKKITYKYDYDAIGNYTLKKEYVDGVLKSVTERAIIYF